MKKFLLDIMSPLRTPLFVVLTSFIIYMFLEKDITGDLGKIGQIVFSKEYHLQSKFEEDIEKQLYWCSTDELKNYDVVFMGDSFTKSSYPFYLDRAMNKKNAKYFSSNIEFPEQAFVSLCNANIAMPRIVVLECVEREMVDRLKNLDFTLPTKVVPKHESFKKEKEKQTDFFTFYKNRIIKNYTVRHIHLKDSLFSCQNKEKELYFYYEDLKFPLEEQIQTAISKLDTLFQLANEKQIHLFFVIAADKYDVYQDFVTDNPYSRKVVLDAFLKYEDNPYFVNTRPLLFDKAKEGVTDLYYADDTHWSPVGAKIVSKEIMRRMESLGVFD